MVISNEALYHAIDDLEAFDEKEIDGIIGQMLQTKVLDLRYKNILDDRKMLLLIDSLIQASEKPQFTPLKEVNLTGSKISLGNFDKLIQTIIQLQSLEHFVAKKCNLTKDYGLYLNKLLLFTRGLKTLVISENNLGDIGLTSLSYAFSEAVNQSNNPTSSTLPSFPLSQASIYTLETLDCSQNELTDGGILSLSRSLLTFVKRSQILQAKGLSLPAPGTPNASAFVSHFAPPIIRLKRLSLDNNPQITDKSAIIIAQLINSKPINAQTINASNSPNRTNSTNLVLTKQNLFPLLLEELSLSNNPQISAKGINALLGDAKQTIYSPLKKLNVSYCQLSFSILDTLAKNIQYGMVYLEELYLEFSEEMALQCVNQSAEKIDKIYGNTSQQMIMSEVFTYLTNVLLNVNHKRVVSVRLITLGKLPRVIFSQCIQSQEENLTLKFEDCIKTLDAMNPASEIFRLPYISNVDAWIQSKIYDNILYNTKPTSSSRTKTTSPGPSPVASPIGKSFGNDSFNTSFLKPISMFDPSHPNDHNNLNSFPGSEDLDEEREATSLNLSSFSIPATPDRKPAKSQQTSQSQPQGRANPLSTSASDLSYGIAYPDKSNTSIVSKKETNGSETGLYLSNEFAVLELKEKEYLKIRKDHSKALHGLTTEIVKLVESSPTKASVSDPQPVARYKEQPSSQSSNPDFEKALESLSKRIPSFNKPTASEETKTSLSSENFSSNAQIPVEQIEQVIVNTLNQYLPQMTSAKKVFKNNSTSSTPGSVPVRYNSPLSLRSVLQAPATAESTTYSPAPPDTPFAFLRPSSAPPSTGATSLNNKNLALSVVPETQNQIVNLSQQIHSLDNWSQNHEHRVLTDLNDLQNRVNNLEKLISNNSSLASVQMLSNEQTSAPPKEENMNQGLASLSNRLINNLSGNKPPSSLVTDSVQNIPTFNTNQTPNIYTQAVNSDAILIQDLTKRLQLLEEILVDTYQTKKIGEANNNNIKSYQVSPAQTIASNPSFKSSPVPNPAPSQDNSQYRREIRHALLDQLLKNSPPQLNINNKFSGDEQSPNYDSHPIDLDPDFSYHAEGQEDFQFEDPSYKNVNEYDYQPQEEDVYPPPLQATQFGSAFKHLNSTLPAKSNNSSNGSKNLKNRLYYNDDNLPPLPILTVAYHTKPHDPPPLPMEYDPSRDHLHDFDFHTPNHSAPVTPASSHSHVSRHPRNPQPSSAHSQQSVQPKEYRPLPRSSTPNKSYMLPTSAAIHKRRTPLIYQS